MLLMCERVWVYYNDLGIGLMYVYVQIFIPSVGCLEAGCSPAITSVLEAGKKVNSIIVTFAASFLRLMVIIISRLWRIRRPFVKSRPQ